MNTRRSLRTTGLFSLLFTTAMFAQIPNGGFESWSVNSNTGSTDPNSWITNNQPFYPNTVERSSPGSAGSYFAKIITRGDASTPYAGYLGTRPNQDPYGPSGFPYTLRPVELTGSWQYHPQGSANSSSVEVKLTKWNSATQQRDLVGEGTLEVGAAISTWTSFTVPISYTSAATPDTANITFQSDALPGSVGSSLWVDDLNFGSVASVSSVADQGSFSLSPVPAVHEIIITSPEQMAEVWILDVDGHIHRQHRVSGIRIVEDLEALPPGTYIMQVRMNDGRVVRKPFVKA